MKIIRQKTHPKRKKILIADDDPDVREVLASRLQASGYDVIHAENGVWAVIKAQKERPDLIILDMKMPSGSGESVFDLLKNTIETAFIPVIFISAFSTPVIRLRMMQIGAADFIEKPFETESLLGKVRKALGE